MNGLKNHCNHIISFSLLFLTLLCGLITFKPFSPFQYYTRNVTSTSQKDALGLALAEASTENKAVIIAMVNKAFVEGDDKSMLDLFLDSFWHGENTRGLVDNLLLVNVDQASYERCKFLRLHCYKLETDGVKFDKEEVYMSDEFIKMMWRRTLFLGQVLRRGYNFIFTDADVLWLRNPFPRLSFNKNIDLQISTDRFNGDQWSQTNPINTGFFMIRSNKNTIQLFDLWYERKDKSTGQKEQDVLNGMLHGGVFKKLGLRVRFLDTLYFSGFCQDSKDIRAVTTVHANCCRTISAKITDLSAVIDDWKRFKRSAVNETSTFGNLKHEACAHSWGK
ncbi:hypothetical protein POPTR_012G112600v4 [Populus trichocarpa]|uniref:Glycosyltransferase n=2 Tax=Populus trichocarpa TaxID=3694 RepID=A0A3N7FVR1_POPTR|nr:uncharacterized protein At1g28695 [Populus trichocarpa]RQO98602.1 hypothetical protein POPTR_012G112600v4 [Populus trichocarpa]|eukprot:XP_024437865.1 uncharacterized protein At1g28695-like [Populus trichocarpa]